MWEAYFCICGAVVLLTVTDGVHKEPMASILNHKYNVTTDEVTCKSEILYKHQST
jgi:hypothetical protein